MLKIGISACFFHADPQRAIFKGMTLQYIEQNVAHWLMQRDVLAFMVPSPDGSTRRHRSRATVDAYADELDGLVLMGGSDVCPETYGEKALRPEWNGDRIRDDYEIALLPNERLIRIVERRWRAELAEDPGSAVRHQRERRRKLIGFLVGVVGAGVGILSAVLRMVGG